MSAPAPVKPAPMKPADVVRGIFALCLVVVMAGVTAAAALSPVVGLIVLAVNATN